MKIHCECCGEEIEINPASLLGQQEKTMTTEAMEQRRKAAKQPKPKLRKRKEDM